MVQMWVAEGGDGFGFAAEAPDRVRVVGELVGQELQRDFPGQPHVFGLVDDAHAAGAELAGDPIMADGAAKHAGGCRQNTRPCVRFYTSLWLRRGR